MKYKLEITIPDNCYKCPCTYESQGDYECLIFNKPLEGTDGCGTLLPLTECKRKRKILK